MRSGVVRRPSSVTLLGSVVAAIFLVILANYFYFACLHVDSVGASFVSKESFVLKTAAAKEVTRVFHDSFLPDSPVLSIQPFLSACPPPLNLSFKHDILLPRVRSELPPLTIPDFVCAARCAASEPELDRSFAYLGGTTQLSSHSLIELCDNGRVPLLIRFSAKSVQWTKCNSPWFTAKHELWAVQRELLVLSRLVALDDDVLFGFDTSDFSRPLVKDPHYLGWQYVEPAVVRFVGDEAHPSLLWPTLPYVRETGYGEFFRTERNENELAWLLPGSARENRLVSPEWSALDDNVFWRGTPTGFALKSSCVTCGDDRLPLIPRYALVSRFAHTPGYDVAFADVETVSPKLRHDVLGTLRWENKTTKDTFRAHKMVLSVNGNTAEWGKIDLVGSGPLLLAVQSLFGYREFYYARLVPFVHYFPIAPDFSNLERTRQFVLANPELAQRVRAQAARLVRERMRPEDLWCYLFRLVHTLGSHQREMNHSSVFQRYAWNTITAESVATFEGSVRFAEQMYRQKRT